MTPSTLLLALFSVALSATAQLAFKAGMSHRAIQAALAQEASGASQWLDRVLVIGMNPAVISGLALYGLSAAVWMLVLAKVDVSVAYPFVGLGFVITMAAGGLLFNEPITLTRIIGTLLVCAGVALVASTS